MDLSVFTLRYTPSTKERNDVRSDVIFAKKLKRFVRWWRSVTIEGVNMRDMPDNRRYGYACDFCRITSAYLPRAFLFRTDTRVRCIRTTTVVQL
jgi:hypothetical protein